MKISSHFSAGRYSTCYLIIPDSDTYCVLIDPGYLNASLFEYIEQRDLTPRATLLTHTHRSHCEGASSIRKVFGAEIYAATSMPDLPTKRIADGQELSIGDLSFEILATPGHSDDSVCYALQPVIFTGDALAAGTLGSTRTSEARAILQRAIHERLLSRADYEIVLPGHGPPTTIGIERRFNIHLMN